MELNLFPVSTHADGNIFRCKQCLGIVCANCYPRYFARNHKCPVCKMDVPHIADIVGLPDALKQLPNDLNRYKMIMCLASRVVCE
eukprot:COSAG05_NODE_1904_length_3853_cov_9.683957_6_plen_85_part_00